jgi:hypothetical protein
MPRPSSHADASPQGISCASRAHARDWIITQQLGRRNLTAEQKKYLIGLRFNSEKKQAARNDLTSDQNDPKLDTAKRLAEEYKVGEATIKRNGTFAKAVDTIASNVGPQARTAILQRDSGMSAQNVVEGTAPSGTGAGASTMMALSAGALKLRL